MKLFDPGATGSKNVFQKCVVENQNYLRYL